MPKDGKIEEWKGRMEQTQLEIFQKKYPLFSYDRYSYELHDGRFVMTFEFSCGEHTFRTIDTVSGVTKEMVEGPAKEELEAYVFHLGLAEMPSYWKAFCSPTIEIRCGSLDATQIAFWQKLFFHGMGEFFYQNQIQPFAPELRIKNQELPARSATSASWRIAGGRMKETANIQTSKLEARTSVLVPVGGGKDSIVSLELLAKAGYDIITWSGAKGSSPAVVELFGKRHPHSGDILISRTLDLRLFELNTAGHPNGHTPFSSVLAFLTTLTARLYGIPYIALSNEGSSNEATGTWMGIDVNHQYSKSFAFEQDFQKYAHHTFGGESPRYFSLLRSLDELEIMRYFVSYPEYFSVFKSCNVGQRENIWCGKCAKCVFVALLLAAYLDDATITKIFGKNMLEDVDLAPHIDALIGKVEFKPFECVGTRAESLRALSLAIERRKEKLPTLLAVYREYVKEHPVTENHIHIQYETAMPEEFKRMLAI